MRIIGWLFVSIALSFALYFPVIDAPFVSDDWHWLAAAHDQVGVLPDLTANYAGGSIGGSYNPMSSLWINALYRVYGIAPVAFHVASVLLHGIVAWLVGILIFLFLPQLSSAMLPDEKHKRLAILGGVFFAVWPTHVEAVAWIASVPHLVSSV